MSEIQSSGTLVPFNYGDAAVRVVMVDGEPWFVLADLCKVLGLARGASQIAERLDDGVRQTYPISDSLGRTQQATVVSESGMYEVVIRSDKPEAVAFRRWITGEVLPQIRRTGQYGIPAIDLSDPIAAIEAVREREGRAIELAKSERAARLEAEAHARELEAPASAWKHLASAEGDYEVADAAKVLSRDPNIKIGRARLFAYMAALGWTYRNRATSRWKAYQTQVENGRLAERFGKPFLHEPSGEMRLGDPTIRITPKGMAELHKRLGGSGQLALVAAS